MSHALTRARARWLIIGFALAAALAVTTVVAQRADGATVANGKTLYSNNSVMSCAVCHGADGRGSIPLAGKNWSVTQIDNVIANGKGSMPAYSPTLSPDQTLSIACYVKDAFEGGIPAGDQARCGVAGSQPTTTTTMRATTTTAGATTTTTGGTTTTMPGTTTTTHGNTTTTITAAPTGPTVHTQFDVAPAGVVTLMVQDGKLVLESVDSDWMWEIEKQKDRDIRIEFDQGSMEVHFRAKLKKNGTIEATVKVQDHSDDHDSDDHDSDDGHENARKTSTTRSGSDEGGGGDDHGSDD